MGGRGANVSIASKATSEPTTSKSITAAAEEEPKKKKNSLSEMFKKRKQKDIEFFFGDTEWRSNKYFKFDHVKDNDNIVIVTKNIKAIKGNFVMIVDNHSRTEKDSNKIAFTIYIHIPGKSEREQINSHV